MATKLVVGLGNPGSSYADNRHNIGFMAIDRIINDYALPTPTSKFHGLLSQGRIDTHKVYAFKPMSFMNVSGEPVGELIRFFKIEPEDVIVIHDELDLELGRVRVKQNGGTGGHNGIKSLDSHLGKNYWRVRLGIDHPGDKNRVSDYVLSDFKKDELDTVALIVNETSRHITSLLNNDTNAFTNNLALTLKET